MNVRFACATGFALAAVSAFAGIFDNALLKGRTDKDGFYKAQEPVTFTLTVEGIKETIPADTYFITWERTGDDGQKQAGKFALPTKDPMTIQSSLAKPGFIRIEARLVDKAGKRVKRPQNGKTMDVFFDGGAGIEPEKLQGVSEPADFDAFWAKQKARLAAVPLKADRQEKAYRDTGVKLYAISVDCAGPVQVAHPRPVTGYLAIPVTASAAKPVGALLLVDGYSTHSIQEPDGRYSHSIITLHINAHGYELGKDAAYYKAFYQSIASHGKSYGFDPEQNQNPETAYFNGMALRVMRALQYLKSLPEWNRKDLSVMGGSQGGLQTVWAAGLDPQVSSASAEVPWCCDLGGITMGRLVGGWRIAWVPALGYYDPINIGKRIPRTCNFTIPRAGLGDYVCPPSGVAVLYNNIKAPKNIKWVQGSEHGYVPPAPNQAFSFSQP